MISIFCSVIELNGMITGNFQMVFLSSFGSFKYYIAEDLSINGIFRGSLLSTLEC